MLPGGETENALNAQSLQSRNPRWLGASSVEGDENRRKAILNDDLARFDIKENPYADDRKPWYEDEKESRVKTYENIIDRKSAEYGVDSDLVKAIMHLETTHGWYDEILESGNLNKTIRPMNIHSKLWQRLGYDREHLKTPENNIDAGIKLLKSIQLRVPQGNIRKFATLYNNLGAKEVSDYGARVDNFYRKKPWKRK